jgi:hypothetical protein
LFKLAPLAPGAFVKKAITPPLPLPVEMPGYMDKLAPLTFVPDPFVARISEFAGVADVSPLPK